MIDSKEKHKLQYELEFLEWAVYFNKSTPIGNYYLKSFKIKEVYYNNNFETYKRKILRTC